MRALCVALLVVTAALAWWTFEGRASARASRAEAPPMSEAAEARLQGAAASAAARLDEAAPEAASEAVPDVDVRVEEAAPGADLVPVDVVVVDGENGAPLGHVAAFVPRAPRGEVTIFGLACRGYVADSPAERVVEGALSRRADRVRVVVPLRREARIRVRVVEGDGRPVRGARVTGAYLGGSTATGAPVPTAGSGPSGADGWLRVKGVPHLLDERAWIAVGNADEEAIVDVRLGDFGEEYAVEARLSARPPWLDISLGGGAGSGLRGRGDRRSTEPMARLEVLVRAADGRMAAGVEVWVGGFKSTTDASGRASFEMPPGSYFVDVRDPDFVWSSCDVTVRAGEGRTIVLSESSGWTARAVLCDSVGRPVPFAPVTVRSGAPVDYVRVESRIQDWAFHTDATGAIEFPALHHAPVLLTFSYGSRSAVVTLPENEPSATVRLPPP